MYIGTVKRIYAYTRRIISCAETVRVDYEVKEKGAPKLPTVYSTEFTFKFISDEKKCLFEEKLAELGIEHRLIKPFTTSTAAT